MKGPKPVLIAIDDEPQMLAFVQEALTPLAADVHTFTDPKEGIAAFREKSARVAIVDLNMPEMDGMEALAAILDHDPSAEVFLLTGHYSTEAAVEAVKRGAADYLTKPITPQRLRDAIGASLEAARQRCAVNQLEEGLLQVFQLEGMIGRSPVMLEVFQRLRRFGAHYRTALITGPTGTGKELAARALHRLSPAAHRPFVPYNCAGFVEGLVETELFGHTRGAFTGATQDRAGLFEHAEGGTLFLDEIGEMPLNIQAKFLRVLQQQEVQRVGSPTVRKVDVRVIAATNRRLKDMVAAGAFREDLYYRLAMLELELPPLHLRPDDLPLLQRHFVQRFAQQYNKPVAGITRRAQAVLARYSWPGNVRELENVLGAACLQAEAEFIDLSDLPECIRSRQGSADSSESEILSFQELQARYARKVLEKVNGNKAKAAELLGISRTTLYGVLESAPARK